MFSTQNIIIAYHQTLLDAVYCLLYKLSCLNVFLKLRLRCQCYSVIVLNGVSPAYSVLYYCVRQYFSIFSL